MGSLASHFKPTCWLTYQILSLGILQHNLTACRSQSQLGGQFGYAAPGCDDFADSSPPHQKRRASFDDPPTKRAKYQQKMILRIPSPKLWDVMLHQPQPQQLQRQIPRPSLQLSKHMMTGNGRSCMGAQEDFCP